MEGQGIDGQEVSRHVLLGGKGAIQDAPAGQRSIAAATEQVRSVG